MISNENIIDDHEFSFSSIGNEFDFVTDNPSAADTNTRIVYEEDLFSESSQNFY